MAKNTRLNSLTVEAIRAVAYKEAADAGADVITVEWVARRLTKSKKWVRENWVRSYGQVLEGDIWIPGGIDEGIRKRQSTGKMFIDLLVVNFAFNTILKSD